MNAVEVRQINMRYGSFRLKDISFDLGEGSILGVIGENGAGKSTLLEIILGLVKADGGSVRVMGCDDLSAHHEVREKIGFVIDRAGFPDLLNANDISSIFKDTYSNWNEELYFDLLKRVDGETDKMMKHLSQGNRMKVLIAAAFAHQPDLVILDEATNFLDPAARTEIVNYLYDYTRDEKKSVIISSHIASDLEKIADDILFLHKGEVLMHAPKDEIIERYRYVTADPALIDQLKDSDIIARRDTGYGAEAVIKAEAANDQMHIRNASLEEIFTAAVKGVI